MSEPADIKWNADKLVELKKAYETARAKNELTFVFEEHDLFVTYAKYLIQYLDRMLPP